MKFTSGDIQSMDRRRRAAFINSTLLPEEAAMVAQQARNWRVARMARVDRNILRLATYELIHTDTPSAVVLDEAVELARRYGSDTSPAFVNGILDAVARVVREPAP